jgi:hypothetical protein
MLGCGPNVRINSIQRKQSLSKYENDLRQRFKQASEKVQLFQEGQKKIEY